MAAEASVHHDHDGGEYHRGEMEIGEQRSTYQVFMGLSKWGSLAVAAVVLWATVTFAVGAGLMVGTLSAVVFVVIGFFLLRSGTTDVENPAGGKH